MTPEEQKELDRNTAIQRMINEYLSDNGMPTLTEKLARDGKTEILGVLTAEHKIMLQQMVIKQYPDINTRINEDRKTTGARQILGVLSSTEWDLIEDMLIAYQEEKEKGDIPEMEYKFNFQ